VFRCTSWTDSRDWPPALKAGGASDADAASFIKRFVHSPLTALVTKATPTPVDDAVLEILRAMFPA
jgi:hypothetical protein